MNSTRHCVALLNAFILLVTRTVAEPGAPLPRSTPESQGISSAAILSFVAEAERKIDALHSFMLVRHGFVVAEGWWAPYAAEEPHLLQSLSKSFTSTAVGIAASEGKLSLDDPVLKFFPEYAPAAPSANLRSMRIRDLLRMSTGHALREHQLNFGFPFRTQDGVKAFLELPVADKPGTHFLYNSAATYVLSAIITKTTGQSVLDFLRPRLFEPLGVVDPTWEGSAQGIPFGGFGLSLRTEEIARFGQLYLQKGRWHGRQLVPESYVAAATSLQTSNGSNPDSDWEQGYGYQFWRCRFGFYRGDGAWGQFCVVMPALDAVLVITGTYDDMQSALNLVWERLVSAFKNTALPDNPDQHRLLTQKLAALALKTPAAAAVSPITGRIAGNWYVFPANEQRLEALEIAAERPGDDVTLVVRIAGITQRIVCGRGSWEKSVLAKAAGALVPTAPVSDDIGETVPVAASGAWTNDDVFTAIICRYRGPFISTYELKFKGDELTVQRTDATTKSWIKEKVRLTGTKQP